MYGRLAKLPAARNLPTSSIDDFRVVHTNLMGGNHSTAGRLVPFCVFTDPELAQIGLNETQAKAWGIGYRLFKVPSTPCCALEPSARRAAF
jgi:pyruvate/2-oxoglutarate dehydrogenase complex dihydrolipoamide dehydrogenase (E3) component